MAIAPSPDDPAEVLVITLWSDGGDVRRTVSVRGPVDAIGGSRPPLRRMTVKDDDGVVSIVRSWLAAVSNSEDRGAKAPR